MTKIITVGVPYDMFGLYNLKQIKALLISRIEEQWIYEEYTGKIVRVAMRLPAEVVDNIRAAANKHFVTNLQYTADILALEGV